MNRRKALSIAGTATATVVGATLALATNVGLLGFSRADAPSLGVLEASQRVTTTTEPPPEIVTRAEDVYAPATPAARPTTTTTAPAASAPAATSASPATSETEEPDRHVEDREDHPDAPDAVTEGLQDDD